METETVTSQCEEGRHDLCLGYQGDTKANYPCECSCHKKKVEKWEDTVLTPGIIDKIPKAQSSGLIPIGYKLLETQAKATWDGRQPEIDRIKEQLTGHMLSYGNDLEKARQEGRKEVIKEVKKILEVATLDEIRGKLKRLVEG